jgi:hypothetical protein
VQVDLDARHADQRLVVHQGDPATGLDPVPEAFLGSAGSNRFAVGVVQRYSDLAAGRGLLAQQVVQGGILLVQEVGGIDQHADLLLGSAKQVPPQARWDR